MDTHTTKIEIEQYLAEFLTSLYGEKDAEGNPTNIIRLPENSYLYDTIWLYMRPQKRNPPTANPNIEIILPNVRKGERKDPRYHNYIGEIGAKVFNKRAKKFFRSRLHEYIDEKKHHDGFTFKEACYMFITEFNIYSIDPESLSKSHQRWREKVAITRKKAYSTR